MIKIPIYHLVQAILAADRLVKSAQESVIADPLYKSYLDGLASLHGKSICFPTATTFRVETGKCSLEYPGSRAPGFFTHQYRPPSR